MLCGHPCRADWISKVQCCVLIQRIPSTQWKNFKKGVTFKIYEDITFCPSFQSGEFKRCRAEHDKSICRSEIIPECAVGLSLRAAPSSDTRFWWGQILCGCMENLFSHSLPGDRSSNRRGITRSFQLVQIFCKIVIFCLLKTKRKNKHSTRFVRIKSFPQKRSALTKVLPLGKSIKSCRNYLSCLWQT